MFKYRKVESASSAKSADNEVRVSNIKAARAYLTYIHAVFEEKKFETIVLSGMGNVIPKCLGIADLVRRRVKDLHEIVEIGTVEMEDTYMPIEEGLDKVVMKRKIPFAKVTLSLKPLDATNPGYHKPLPPAEVLPMVPSARREPREHREFHEGEEEGEGRRRGFGRRRRGGFRGRRGGFRGGFRGRRDNEEGYYEPREGEERRYDRPRTQEGYDYPRNEEDREPRRRRGPRRASGAFRGRGERRGGIIKK